MKAAFDMLLCHTRQELAQWWGGRRPRAGHVGHGDIVAADQVELMKVGLTWMS